jgi:hypothetical protein
MSCITAPEKKSPIFSAFSQLEIVGQVPDWTSSDCPSCVTATRHELLFNRDVAAQNMPIFDGLTEDRYVSAFL